MPELNEDNSVEWLKDNWALMSTGDDLEVISSVEYDIEELYEFTEINRKVEKDLNNSEANMAILVNLIEFEGDYRVMVDLVKTERIPIWIDEV